jgi:hypothetical protein
MIRNGTEDQVRRDNEINGMQELLTRLCEDVERQVKPNLHGVTGILIYSYLPQVWASETDCGEYTLFPDT